MKQIYSFIALIVLTLTATAQTRPAITFTAWFGNWSIPANWDLNRVPQNGDSIIIPSGKGVVFDKGDSLSNIYLNIAGALTVKKKMELNASSVIALTGTINAWGANRTVEVIEINDVKKYDENASTWVYGPGFATSGTGVSPNGFSVNMTLPVTFSGFYAVKNNDAVVLNWSTAQELNNNNFEIQRSFDGNNWTVIAVMLGAGNASTTQQYSYTDKNMTAAIAYYRIRQVDIDGKYTYTTVKVITTTETTAAAKIYATSKTVNIEFSNEIKNAVTVRVMSMNGQIVAQQVYQQGTYRIAMDVNKANTGVYAVQISDNKGWSEAKKVAL